MLSTMPSLTNISKNSWISSSVWPNFSVLSQDQIWQLMILGISRVTSLMIHLWGSNKWTRKINHHFCWLYLQSKWPSSKSLGIISSFVRSICWILRKDWIMFPEKSYIRRAICKVYIRYFCWRPLLNPLYRIVNLHRCQISMKCCNLSLQTEVEINLTS